MAIVPLLVNGELLTVSPVGTLIPTEVNPGSKYFDSVLFVFAVFGNHFVAFLLVVLHASHDSRNKSCMANLTRSRKLAS